MSLKFPVDFQALAQGARGQNASDYPYAIKATDLMKNFVYASLDADQTLIEESVGQGGHKSRKLKIPAVPSEGTRSLTATGGLLSWDEVEGDKEFYVVINGALKLCKFVASDPYDPPA
jgi:hypothetical protein